MLGVIYQRHELRRGVLDTTWCDKVCPWLATGQWFSLGSTISSTNKTDRHDITEILLKVTLKIISPYNMKSECDIIYNNIYM